MFTYNAATEKHDFSFTIPSLSSAASFYFSFNGTVPAGDLLLAEILWGFGSAAGAFPVISDGVNTWTKIGEQDRGDGFRIAAYFAVNAATGPINCSALNGSGGLAQYVAWQVCSFTPASALGSPLDNVHGASGSGADIKASVVTSAANELVVGFAVGNNPPTGIQPGFTPTVAYGGGTVPIVYAEESVAGTYWPGSTQPPNTWCCIAASFGGAAIIPPPPPTNVDFSGFIPGVYCYGLSANLTDGAQFIGLQVSVAGPAPLTGHNDDIIPPPAPPEYNLTGFAQELFGGQLFERIILIPYIEKLGFVITDTQFGVEVWNTRRNLGDILDSINVIGPGDLIVENPFPMPTFYGALNSRTYQVIVNRTGAPTIAAEICFIFATGIGGTCIAVSGSRIVLFSPPIDWDKGFKEGIAYLTDVLKSYSDAEQRRALRQLARRSATFKAAGIIARDAAGIETQIWGWQNQPYGVPWWPDASPLLTDAPIGSTELFFDTSDRLFAPGGIACVWRDEFTFEAVSVTAVTPNSITLTSPTQHLWRANPATLVMPVFLGRLPVKVDVERLFSGADVMEMVFTGEAQQVAPAPTETLTQYKGFDVLEIPAHWPTDLKRQYNRSMITIDPKVGPVTVIDRGGSPYISQPFPMLLLNHAQVTQFRAFILARFGRLSPFWLPTWDQDLVLAQDIAPSDTGIKIQSVFYTRFMFPNKARRYVALIPMDSSGNLYHKVVSSVDNGDGTETLQFESAIGHTMLAARTMVSFLVFARMDSDENEIAWLNNDLAEATLEFQELPREVP